MHVYGLIKQILVICFDRKYYSLYLQVLFVTNWNADETKLKEFERMLKVLFLMERERIDPRLIEVTMSYLTFVCEISLEDAAALERMVAIPAKRNLLRQQGIRKIELEFEREFGSITVSLLDGIGI